MWLRNSLKGFFGKNKDIPSNDDIHYSLTASETLKKKNVPVEPHIQPRVRELASLIKSSKYLRRQSIDAILKSIDRESALKKPVIIINNKRKSINNLEMINLERYFGRLAKRLKTVSSSKSTTETANNSTTASIPLLESTENDQLFISVANIVQKSCLRQVRKKDEYRKVAVDVPFRLGWKLQRKLIEEKIVGEAVQPSIMQKPLQKTELNQAILIRKPISQSDVSKMLCSFSYPYIKRRVVSVHLGHFSEKDFLSKRKRQNGNVFAVIPLKNKPQKSKTLSLRNAIEKPKEPKINNFSHLFTRNDSVWKCSVCLVDRNPLTSTNCQACESPRYSESNKVSSDQQAQNVAGSTGANGKIFENHSSTASRKDKKDFKNTFNFETQSKEPIKQDFSVSLEAERSSPDLDGSKLLSKVSNSKNSRSKFGESNLFGANSTEKEIENASTNLFGNINNQKKVEDVSPNLFGNINTEKKVENTSPNLFINVNTAKKAENTSVNLFGSINNEQKAENTRMNFFGSSNNDNSVQTSANLFGNINNDRKVQNPFTVSKQISTGSNNPFKQSSSQSTPNLFTSSTLTTKQNPNPFSGNASANLSFGSAAKNQSLYEKSSKNPFQSFGVSQSSQNIPLPFNGSNGESAFSIGANTSKTSQKRRIRRVRKKI